MIKHKAVDLEWFFPDKEERKAAKSAMLAAFAGNKEKYEGFLEKLDSLKKLHKVVERHDRQVFERSKKSRKRLC